MRIRLARSARASSFLIVVASFSTPAFSGTYFPSTSADPERIVHPQGYTGATGVLNIDVCIDPSSPYKDEMVEPLQRAIATWNVLLASTGNMVSGQEVPDVAYDFESVALHELGHCLGLGHSNLGKQDCILGGTLCFNREITNSTRGVNGEWDAHPGLDAIDGSSDDLRGDDINKHWFKKVDNNPFSLAPVVDSTTYGRNVADLPAGHLFPTNGNRTVADLIYGLEDTVTVMFSSLTTHTSVRSLTADDIATLRYAMAGLNEKVDTTDDYTINVRFSEDGSGCEIVLGFSDLGEIGLCESGFVDLGNGHYSFGAGQIIAFAMNRPWHFSGGPDLLISKTDGGVTAAPGGTISYTIEVSNVGTADTGGNVVITETIPTNTTFTAAQSHPDWNCYSPSGGDPCSLDIGIVNAGIPSVGYTFTVVVDDPLLPGVLEISNTADALDQGGGGEANSANNTSTVVTPIVIDKIFLDGFESGDLSGWSSASQ